MSVGYSLRVGFEPTYSPLQVGTFSPIELPEHVRPCGRNWVWMSSLLVSRWYLRLDLNQRPTGYESVAPPLSYTGIKSHRKLPRPLCVWSCPLRAFSPSQKVFRILWF